MSRWADAHRRDPHPVRRRQLRRRGLRSPAVDLFARNDVVGDVPVVSFEGVIDLASVPMLHDHLRAVVAGHAGTTVAVDLDGVTALDDCGLGVLLGAAGLARQHGGDLVVVATGERLRDRFRVTGLDRAVEVRERL